jgi:mevalonate kinase
MTETAHSTTTFKAAGKFLLFGEYLVLDGAKSLALPLKYGQKMEVRPRNEGTLWEAISPEGSWLTCTFDNDLNVINTDNSEASTMVQRLLLYLRAKQPHRSLKQHFQVSADFPLKWGLGSSSTLISVLSQWADVNPYDLLQHSFGGSGYDIACATADGPLTFQWTNRTPVVNEAELHKDITEHCLFVYSGQKQSSRAAIETYRKKDISAADIQAMNYLVDAALLTNTIAGFEEIMTTSESLLSSILEQQPLKAAQFNDYPYAIKSLGAWGGDFFLATYRDLSTAKNYFESKGLHTAFTYNEMVV